MKRKPGSTYMPLLNSELYYVGNYYGVPNLDRDRFNKVFADVGFDSRFGPALDEETGQYYPATEVVGIYRTLSVGVSPRFPITLEQALQMESDIQPTNSDLPLCPPRP